MFEGIKQGIEHERFDFLSAFFGNFYNSDVLLGKRISKQVVHNSWNVGSTASAIGTFECVHTWYTDFRADVAKIDVPTLVMHGDADRILPIASTGNRTGSLIKGAKYVVVKDAPHGMLWTHADEVNAALVSFLA